MRDKENEKKRMILNLSHGILSQLLKIMKLVGNHLQEDQQNSCLQNFRRVKATKGRLWKLSFHIAHHVLCMNDVYDMSEKSTQDPRTIL